MWLTTTSYLLAGLCVFPRGLKFEIDKYYERKREIDIYYAVKATLGQEVRERK